MGIWAHAHLPKPQQSLGHAHDARWFLRNSSPILIFQPNFYSKFLHVMNWVYQWNMQKITFSNFLTIKATILDTHGMHLCGGSKFSWRSSIRLEWTENNGARRQRATASLPRATQSTSMRRTLLMATVPKS